ncbi:MAG: HlyD family efflux transporter periplasmic adaptor subunit [Ignavibacteriales bacterium]
MREEIVVYPGPSNYAGEPSWTIHDPTRNRFFRIDWLTYEILGRWSFGDPKAIADTVNAQSPLHVGEDEVNGVARFLVEKELIRSNFPGSSAYMNELLHRRHHSWWQWLLHHYLFIRIPLVRPDAWLGKHIDKVRFFGSPLFLIATLAAFFVGAFQTFQQWDQIRSALVDTISPTGALSYALTLTVVKICHEMGHAFTAKHYGCRVPTMGMALLVMAPVAYTDTTDAWKLQDKRQRLHVATAGVLTELTIAVWATALAPFIPDGPLHTMVFLLATTTWVSAIAMNFNPLMRYDGYFILSDWLDIPNLHERAFAITRWRIRQLVLGLKEPPPESFPPSTERILIALSVVTWMYRLGLYLGIAFLVYHFAVKLVGILLFCVEMWFFILGPILRESRLWWALRSEWRGNTRSRRVIMGAGLILVLLLLPLPTPIGATAVLGPQDVFNVYAPEAGQLTTFHTQVGERIAKGEVVAAINSPSVSSDRTMAQANVDALRRQVDAASVDPAQRSQLLALQSQLSAADANLENSAEQVQQLELRSPYAGKLMDVDPDLQPGDWVGKGEALAVVVGEGPWEATAYLTGNEAPRVRPGDHARFTPEGLKGSSVPMVVEGVDADATHSLPSGLFAASAGGDVLVRQKDGKLAPEKAIYRVRLRAVEVPDNLVGHSWRGRVVVRGAWSSPLFNWLRTAAAVIVREAGF